MKLLTLCTLCLVATALTAPANAQQCSAPSTAVTVPDGKTATMEQMTAAQGQVKALQTATDEYTKCLDGLMASKKASLNAQEKKELIDSYNAAVNSLSKLAAKFNDQLKAFKSR
jgi:DNA-binding FrmR family transcriptional regulator